MSDTMRVIMSEPFLIYISLSLEKALKRKLFITGYIDWGQHVISTRSTGDAEMKRNSIGQEGKNVCL